MSMSKRLLFDRNPLDDTAREQLKRQTAGYLGEFTNRLAMKRKAKQSAKYWDQYWPMSVEQATRELGFEVVRVNDGLFTRTENERDAIKDRAEVIWAEKLNGANPRPL